MNTDTEALTYDHIVALAGPADVGEPVAWMAVVTHSRSQGPQAHFVSDAKLARQWDYNGVVDGEPCIVQPLFTAHQLAAAVAAERERASVLYDMLLNRPELNTGLESEYLAWTSKCYQVTGAYKAAIRAGAPPDTLRDAARGATRERCGWDKARCDVHHRVARCDGGLNTISNGEVICPNCHRVAHEQSGGGEA